MITLITTTGWRSKAFALAEKYVARQTYKGDIQWIVVSDDDPKTPTPCTMKQEYYQGPKVWKSGYNTQRLNLDLAITKIHPESSSIIIWEDDDYYRPEYIQVMVDMLKYADLVGECNSIYYSISTRGYRNMNNFQHASLCQTAFNRNYLNIFDRAVNSGNTYIDLELWGKAPSYKYKRLLFDLSQRLSIGTKGLPGRGGIGYGHTNTSEFTSDTHFAKLKELIGPEDAQVYIDLLK